MTFELLAGPADRGGGQADAVEHAGDQRLLGAQGHDAAGAPRGVGGAAALARRAPGEQLQVELGVEGDEAGAQGGVEVVEGARVEGAGEAEVDLGPGRHVLRHRAGDRLEDLEALGDRLEARRVADAGAGEGRCERDPGGEAGGRARGERPLAA
ncbi:hypothetical protein [Nannocystis pusilla]|uniref:hypothetical protein n=1 Tax=Nannocystis pusilla TaxID=889268 RepID=UPI003DA5E998